jgi:hypothetical protein
VRRAARAVLIACAVAPGAPGAAAPGAAFEDLAREAAPVTDLGMLLAPFVDDCRRAGGEVERARCELVRASLRARLPGRSFLFVRDGADGVVMSPFDPRARVVRLTVVGCLSCKQLVEAAPGERRYVTLRMPTRGPSGGPVAAEVARASVNVASPAEAEKWARTVQPFLRVELLFRPADQPWTVGVSRGYAFTPLGVRVYNRCTGEVLFSEPPSREQAPRETQCTPAGETAAEETAEEAPATLTPTTINEVMAGVRGDLDACVAQTKMGGTARLVFDVAPSGLPERVGVEGSAAGTPVGQCLAGVGMKVKFPPFRGEKQRFKYPVPLRR